MLHSLVIFVLAGALPVFSASADAWRNRSIYQLVTDRFATSDGSSPPCDTSQRQYCGGTWQGVINKLDYIQDMGFDAVWISPIVANIEGNTSYGEAFHGYWSQDINAINSHFGSMDDLKALSSALHDRSMYLMLDVVVNHMAADTNPPNYSTFTPFSTQSDFHAECFIDDYNNQTDVEQCWLGDQNVPLADINTENQDIVNTLYSWITTVVGNYSADGLRIDTVKHIRKDFWPQFAQSAGVFTIGEVLDNSTSYVGPYTDVIDSVLDYPSWYPLVAGFQSPTGNLSALAATVEQAQSSYKNGQFMTGSFLENHDQPRFPSMTQDQALIMNAMTWPFIQDSIPIMYYGQEQGYAGANDPYNREALWLSGYYTEDKPYLTQAKTLNAARKLAIAANSSFLTTASRFVATESTLAVIKPPLLTLLSNGGNTSTPNWNVPDAGFQANELLVDVLTCTPVSADETGGVMTNGDSGMPKVLMPRSALDKSGGVCPNLANLNVQTSSAQSYAAPVLVAVIFAVFSGLLYV